MGSDPRRLTPSSSRRALGLVRATHAVPALAVTVLVSVVSAARGARGLTLLWAVLSTAAGQASVGWSNDYLDRDRDRAVGRREKPIVAGDVSSGAVLVAAIVAFPLSILLSVPLGLPEALVMAVAVGAAWAYNAILKATVFSWLPYAVAFGLAPVYAWLATSGRLPPAWIVAAAALLGFAGHLLNVVPDLESDRRAAVLGLPHRVGLRASLLLACGALAGVLALVLIRMAPLGTTTWQFGSAVVALVLIAAVASAGATGKGRLGFLLTIAAAAAIIATFLLSPGAARL